MRAADDRPRVADHRLVRRVARDEAALHAASIAAPWKRSARSTRGRREHAAAARRDGRGRRRAARRRRITSSAGRSVTKLVAALATLVAAEEGVVDLDEPAGPEGSTVRHLLAHASGLAVRRRPRRSRRPGERRIYSNHGLRGARRARRRARGDAVRATTSREAVLRAARARRDARRRAAGADVVGTLGDMLALRPGAARADADRAARRSPRRRRVAVPGPRRRAARLRPLRRRTTGASASSSATTSRRTGPARATRRARSATSARSRDGTFLWVDPERRLVAAACSPTASFGEWAEDRVAGALGRGPQEEVEQ